MIVEAGAPVAVPIEIEILSDGRTCWVNGPDGCCLGRYVHSKLMIHMDVHRDAHGQVENGNQCLDCAKGATWLDFKDAMHQHHGVNIPDRHKPLLA